MGNDIESLHSIKPGPTKSVSFIAEVTENASFAVIDLSGSGKANCVDGVCACVRIFRHSCFHDGEFSSFSTSTSFSNPTPLRTRFQLFSSSRVACCWSYLPHPHFHRLTCCCFIHLEIVYTKTPVNYHGKLIRESRVLPLIFLN